MSHLTPRAAALLQRARELPEPERLAAVRGALARKLEAGAAPSCGEAEVLGKPGLAPRGLWSLGGKLGLAAGLTLLAGAGVLLLRAAPHAAVRSAAAPPSAAHAPATDGAAHARGPDTADVRGPDTAAAARGPDTAYVPAVSVEVAVRSTVRAPQTVAPHTVENAARPARTRGKARSADPSARELPRSARHARDPLARAASARGARNVQSDAAQPARGIEPPPVSDDPSAVASRTATAHLAANSSSVQNAAATPPARQPVTPAEEGARVASARVADEERLPGDRVSGEQQHPSAAPVSERDRLEREVAMLDGARAALERGDDARALQILDAHAREFPAGVLSEEQLALRARALCALGRIDEGRRAVQRLAARSPESPHLKRSQRACGIAE